MTMKFQIRTPSGSDIVSANDDNIDLLIDLDDGRSFSATIFTLKNIHTLMKNYRASGECANGTYIWAKDMILVESISKEIVDVVIAYLVASKEIESCCTRVR